MTKKALFHERLISVRFPQLQDDPSVHSNRRVNKQADVGLCDERRFFHALPQSWQRLTTPNIPTGRLQLPRVSLSGWLVD